MVNEAFQKNVCPNCRGEVIEGAIRYLDYHREARKWLKTRLGVIITILLFPLVVPYLVWQEIEDATRCPHCYRKIKQWFKTRLGIIITILLFPIVVPYLVWKETKWNKGIKIAITAACLIIVGISLENSHPYLETESLENVVQETNSQSIGTEVSEDITTKPTSNVSATPEPASVEIPKYSVVHESSSVRYDGGKVFYVLIDPIDITSSNFKDKIKALVRKIAAQENNKKVSILIFDKNPTLDLYYRQYVELSLGRVRTEAESEDLSIHFIGSYDGALETMHPINSLTFFPSAFNSTKSVGKYVETIEFDALHNSQGGMVDYSTIKSLEGNSEEDRKKR